VNFTETTRRNFIALLLAVGLSSAPAQSADKSPESLNPASAGHTAGQTDMAAGAAVEADVEAMAGLAKLADDAVSKLKQRIQGGPPFQLGERRARIEHLEKLPATTDGELAEKYRRAFDAYRVELDYAKTVEAYRDLLRDSDDGRLVNFLRVGRLALYYQTMDGRESAVWHPDKRQWLRLSGEDNESIRQALRIARKIDPPQLMVLPLFVPDARGGQSDTPLAAADEASNLDLRQSECLAVIREAAASMESLLSASNGHQLGPLIGRLSNGQQTVALDDVIRLFDGLQNQLDRQGRISIARAPVYAANGQRQDKEVLRVGDFAWIGEGLYLSYWPEVDRWVELPRQPASDLLRLSGTFLRHDSSSPAPLPIDPSAGQVLQLLVEIPSLGERIAQGGAVGYLILALAAFAGLLSGYRFVDLSLIGRRINRQLQAGEFRLDNPLGRLYARLQQLTVRDEELLYLTVEDVLANEQARLAHALSFLKLVAAIAPMLGLLGTVTGMIETFQTIAMHGSGDPKLMSGGISEALVTTVEGLVTAIPILFLHSLLNSKSQALGTLLEAHATVAMTRHIERWRQQVEEADEGGVG